MDDRSIKTQSFHVRAWLYLRPATLPEPVDALRPIPRPLLIPILQAAYARVEARRLKPWTGIGAHFLKLVLPPEMALSPAGMRFDDSSIQQTFEVLLKLPE